MRGAVLVAVVTAIVSWSPILKADAGGAGYWLNGSAGSLVAAPMTPGWSDINIFYYSSANAGGDVTVSKQITSGGVTVPFNGKVDAKLESQVGIYIPGFSYTFPEKVAHGAQFTISLSWPVATADIDANATITGTAGGVNVDLTKGKSDSATGMGDMYPNFNLRWNKGVHNGMWYVQPGIPIAHYDPNRMANLGAGHMAVDSGGAYTYLSPKNGWEASVETGFTYNIENYATKYQNGIDSHTEWGVSKFLHAEGSTRIFQVGAAGYYYQQLTGDSGEGAKLGDFKSRVASAGPQFAISHKWNKDWEAYLSIKTYWEFAADKHEEGVTTYLTYVISRKAHPRTAGINNTKE